MLQAYSCHTRSDVISSLFVLVGIVLGKSFWWIDGVLCILVALLVFYAAYEFPRDSINPLLGKIPEYEMIQGIQTLCKNVCGDDVHAHHFHIHEYGDHTELTFHINLPGEIDLAQAHHFATQIEMNIRKKLNIESTIHVEPTTKDKE